MTRDDPASFAPPPAFGPFRVLHQIGIGALGPVFRTYEPTRDRLVAVKLFRLDITPEQAQALADELAHACDAGLFHPSIVEPIAAGVEGTAAYRAEEYVAAESLDVAMRHYAPAAIEKALPFITQLAGAIDFARAAGVGHGGLHPRDVFVTPDEARASGFGIVESLERAGIRAPVRRPYTAPERIAGEAWSTPADVFSLAVIAYELLTGRRPSGTGDQIGALGAEHPAALRSVLARAMDEHPSRRYPSALAFASALEAAARGAGVTDVALTAGAIRGELLAEPERTPFQPEPKPEVVPQLESVTEIPEPIEPAREPLEAVSQAGARHASPREEDREVGQVAAEHASPELATTFIEDAADDLRERDQQRTGRISARAQEEPLADLAIDAPPLRSEAPLAAADAHAPYEEPERSRTAMLPVALGVLIGVLIGLAGGYALFNHAPGRETPPPSAAAAPPRATPAPSASSQPQRSGQAWSEQAVVPPPARAPQRADAPPPVPPEGPPPRAARATRGTLIVESTPKNAAVTVNGKWRGRTPVTIDDLPFGTHTIRIVQPGYTVARQSVTLSGTQPSRTLTFQLQRPGRPATSLPTPPAPAARGVFSGSLFVASNPAGARVFVDGRPVGTAPLRIPGISIGSHVIRLELPDHRIWTTSERVIAGQETRVTGSLERIQ